MFFIMDEQFVYKKCDTLEEAREYALKCSVNVFITLVVSKFELVETVYTKLKETTKLWYPADRYDVGPWIENITGKFPEFSENDIVHFLYDFERNDKYYEEHACFNPEASMFVDLFKTFEIVAYRIVNR